MHRKWIEAAVLLATACAPHAPLDTTPTFTVTVARAAHASRIAVPLLWQGSGTPDPALCAHLDGRGDPPPDAPLVPALLSIEPTAVRFAGSELLALNDGELPELTEAYDPALADPISAAAYRYRDFHGACGLPDHPVDFLLAVAPGTPLRTLVHVLVNGQHAGIEGYLFLVAGGSGPPTKPSDSFASDELRVHLRRAETMHARIDDETDEHPVGLDLAGLAPLLAGRRLGCVDLDAAHTPWDQLVGELDTLFGLGARRFNLQLEPDQDTAPKHPAGPGEPVAVRIGNTVAVLPMLPPRFYASHTHGPPAHPCVGHVVKRPTQPEPADKDVD